MSRRPQTEYKPRPIAAAAAEIPYRSLQTPRTATTAGLPHHERNQSTSSGGGSVHGGSNVTGFGSGNRPRQRITSGGDGNGGQTTQSDDREEGRSSNDSSGGQGSGNSGSGNSNSNSTDTKSSGSTNPSTTSTTAISAASATSLLSTATTPAPEPITTAYYPPSGTIVSYSPLLPLNAPPLQFDALVEHVARTRGMPEPGLEYFYARRVLWLLPPPTEPRPVSPSPSRIKLEALLNQPGAVESEEVWKAGLKNVWKGLVGGNQLRKRLPLGIVLKILQAGWLRDGTWPEGMVAPSWDPIPAPSTSAAIPGGVHHHSTMDPSISARNNNTTIPSLPPIAQEYPYHYPYPSRVGAAYSGSPSSGDQLHAAEQAALQQQYAQQYGPYSSAAYPSSRPPTEPPTSGTPEPTGPPNAHGQSRVQEYDDGFAGDDDPEGDVDDDEGPDDDDEEDEQQYGADDGRHEGG